MNPISATEHPAEVSPRWSTQDELLVWTVSRIDGGRRHGGERDCHVVYSLTNSHFIEQTRKYRASAEQCIELLQSGRRAGTIQRKVAVDSIIAVWIDDESGRVQIRTINGTHRLEPIGADEAGVLAEIATELQLRMPAGGAEFSDMSDGPTYPDRRVDGRGDEEFAAASLENARLEDAPDAYQPPRFDVDPVDRAEIRAMAIEMGYQESGPETENASEPEAGALQPEAGVLQPEAGVLQPEAGVLQPEAVPLQAEPGVLQAEPEAEPVNYEFLEVLAASERPPVTTPEDGHDLQRIAAAMRQYAAADQGDDGSMPSDITVTGGVPITFRPDNPITYVPPVAEEPAAAYEVADAPVQEIVDESSALAEAPIASNLLGIERREGEAERIPFDRRTYETTQQDMAADHVEEQAPQPVATPSVFAAPEAQPSPEPSFTPPVEAAAPARNVPSIFDRRGIGASVDHERPGWVPDANEAQEEAEAADGHEADDDERSATLPSAPPTLAASPSAGTPGMGGSVGFNPDFDVNPFR